VSAPPRSEVARKETGELKIKVQARAFYIVINPAHQEAIERIYRFQSEVRHELRLVKDTWSKLLTPLGVFVNSGFYYVISTFFVRKCENFGRFTM
jgi:hypothetical protein